MRFNFINKIPLELNKKTMDYVVGSVAALISGNVTPNRPKIVRRAVTPTKHPPSPNVTPKSEFVDDRSIFLSPTQQKKKAVVKKSPKRIFQNPDLDATEDSEGNSCLISPKAEKVKKHLKEQLEADDMKNSKKSHSKSPSTKLDKSSDDVSPKKKSKIDDKSQVSISTPKKKKGLNSESNLNEDDINSVNDANTKSVETNITESNAKTPKKKRKSITDVNPEASQSQNTDQEAPVSNTETTKNQTNQEKKKNKKRKKKNKSQALTETPIENKENSNNATETQNSKKKKKRKNKAKQTEQSTPITEDITPQETKQMDVDNESESDSEEVKSRNIPNPNAIIEKDSDSEHESDDEIESENEQENEKIFTNENEGEESSDEEEEEEKSNSKNNTKKKDQNEKETVVSEEEIKRTLFVGNVPFSSKCKKEIKKIFSKYGQIETIRIRTIPVKDARVTPKLAVIKNELHPERTTVNVYVKYSDPVSVSQALSENNTVLNGNHLRVTPSEQTGAEHDPHCAVFVGNLSFALEDDVFRSKFEKCGDIVSVRIIRDKKTNAGKGFGYVNFASKDGVELALALSEEDLTIKNRILRVKRCSQQRPGGKPGGGGKWGQQGGSRPHQQGGNRANQGQAGKWGGERGGKWGNQGPGGGRGQGHGGGRGQGQGGKWGNQGGDNRGGQGQGGKWGNQGQGREEGAMRRLMNKRKQQEGTGDGPPNKRQKNLNQPSADKKPRKEFVGMTADKKKKKKFDKGQKKKKALSEILTKYNK